VSDVDCGIHYGTIDYWVRLRVPMEQALRLYKVTHSLYNTCIKLVSYLLICLQDWTILQAMCVCVLRRVAVSNEIMMKTGCAKTYMIGEQVK